MNRLILASSSALLLLAPLAAQETAAQGTSSGAALTIHTTDTRMARNALRNFGSADEMPEIGEGQAVVLTLDDGGQMTASVGENRGYLHLSAHPPALMRTFAAQVQQGRAMAQMFGGMGLGEAGFDYKQINQMIDTAFSIPEQIDRLEVHFAEEPSQDGVDLNVSLVPIADSWMGTMVAALAPSADGVTSLEDDGAMVAGAVDVNLPKLAPSLMPMMKFFSAMGTTNDDERAAAAKMTEESVGVMSGAMSFQWSLDSGMESIVGVLDAAKMAEMWDSEDYAAMVKRTSEAAGNAVAEFNKSAGEHRGVRIAEMRVEYDTPEDMPLAEDGIMLSHNAVVGKTMLSTGMVSSTASLKSLIDMALDGEFEAQPLGQGVLMTARVAVAEMVDFMAEMQNAPLPDEQLPETANIVVTKQGNGVGIRIQVR